MSLAKRLSNLVILRKANNCESCGSDFSCEVGLGGCWCSSVKVSDKTRDYLRQNYKSCLCQTCLEKIEAEISEKND